MKPSGEKMTAKQERALLALLEHGTIAGACQAIGISDVTLWRMMQLPEFQKAYRGARRQVVEGAIAQLQKDCTIAVRVLRDVAEDQSAPASARVSAARTILEQSINAVELIDMQERIERLEELQDERGKQIKNFRG